MPDSIADELIRRQEGMKSRRGTFESMWTDIARMVMPRADDFNFRGAPGQRKGEQFIFDSTAQLALPAFAAALESMLTPRTQKWHGLKPVDPDIVGDDEIAAWCERKRDLLFRVRYSPQANYASNAYEIYLGLGVFGTSAMLIEDGLASGIRYRSIPLSELFIAEDPYGVVDTVHRKYQLTARQAVRRWPDKMPEAITKAAEKEPDREFDFLHVCQPNHERRGNDPTYKGMAKAAFDICFENRALLYEGGYRVMPYAVSRYVTAPREVYGRSPAWDAFADIKTVNEQSRTSLRWGQLAADPPWATADVDAISPFNMRPGAINPGYIDEQGRILAQSLEPKGDPRIGLEMMDQRRQSINRSFLVTLFQILVETPEMTATEAMLRAQEKGALLAPTVGRQQSEFLGVEITRELDILNAAGALDDMPMALRDRGGVSALAVEYDSPLTRTQRSEETAGILRTLEALGTLAQYDPAVLKTVNAVRTSKRLRDGFGAPVDMLNSEEEMAAIKEEEDAAKMTQDVLGGAQVAAGAAKDLASAASTAQSANF